MKITKRKQADILAKEIAQCMYKHAKSELHPVAPMNYDKPAWPCYSFRLDGQFVCVEIEPLKEEHQFALTISFRHDENGKAERRPFVECGFALAHNHAPGSMIKAQMFNLANYSLDEARGKPYIWEGWRGADIQFHAYKFETLEEIRSYAKDRLFGKEDHLDESYRMDRHNAPDDAIKPVLFAGSFSMKMTCHRRDPLEVQNIRGDILEYAQRVGAAVIKFGRSTTNPLSQPRCSESPGKVYVGDGMWITKSERLVSAYQSDDTRIDCEPAQGKGARGWQVMNGWEGWPIKG